MSFSANCANSRGLFSAKTLRNRRKRRWLFSVAPDIVFADGVALGVADMVTRE